MLTLITGTPGAGKTLFTLQRARKETNPEKGEQRRPIYIHNIAEVNHQYFQSKELTDPDKWYELPEGSLIIFDEAQFVFPQRQKDAKPDKVEKFSTHRHRGYDIFITTQDPMNVDVFIRRMCGRHFHIHRILGREAATVYEYDHYQADPTGWAEKKQAISISGWKFPKKLYDQYKSATQHTVKPRTPWKLYALPVIALAVIALGYSAYHRIKARATGPSSAEVQQMIDAGEFESAAGPVVNGGTGGKGPMILTKEDWLKAYEPLVPGVLHTAPAYLGLNEAKMMPKPYCIQFEAVEGEGVTECRCYTQQMTIYDTDLKICRYWAKNGWFDPTKEDVYASSSTREGAQPSRAAAPSNGLSLRGRADRFD